MALQRKSIGVLQPVNDQRISIHCDPVKPSEVRSDENSPAVISRRKTNPEMYENRPVNKSVKVVKQDAETQTDAFTCVHCHCSASDTDASEDPELVRQMLVQDEASPEYWTILAERRREALAETLEENKQLHDEIKQLQEDNARLLELATQAEFFASMLKKLTEDTDEEAEEAHDTNSDSGTEKEADSVAEEK